MKNRFHSAIIDASETRAMFVLMVVIFLRAKRIIPTLRPHHLLIPATTLQIIVFVFAALHPEHFIPTLAIGNFIIVGIAILPSTFQHPKPSVHWVKTQQ